MFGLFKSNKERDFINSVKKLIKQGELITHEPKSIQKNKIPHPLGVTVVRSIKKGSDVLRVQVWEGKGAPLISWCK